MLALINKHLLFLILGAGKGAENLFICLFGCGLVGGSLLLVLVFRVSIAGIRGRLRLGNDSILLTIRPLSTAALLCSLQ